MTDSKGVLVTERILNLLRSGISVESAVAAHRLQIDAFQNWMSLARAALEHLGPQALGHKLWGPYIEFADDVYQALGQAEVRLQLMWSKAAEPRTRTVTDAEGNQIVTELSKGDWKAAQALLQVMKPARYAPTKLPEQTDGKRPVHFFLPSEEELPPIRDEDNPEAPPAIIIETDGEETEGEVGD